jgi:hypothetical protein
MIPEDRVLPSEDGDVWLFFKSYKDGYQSTPFSFFVPRLPTRGRFRHCILEMVVIWGGY